MIWWCVSSEHTVRWPHAPSQREKQRCSSQESKKTDRKGWHAARGQWHLGPFTCSLFPLLNVLLLLCYYLLSFYIFKSSHLLCMYLFVHVTHTNTNIYLIVIVRHITCPLIITLNYELMCHNHNLQQKCLLMITL